MRRDFMRFLLGVFIVTCSCPAWAQSKPWTTVGSAGTVDEDSLKDVALSAERAEISIHSGPGTMGVVRYNVVAVDDTVGVPGVALDVRFRDAVPADQVLVKLQQLEFATGNLTTLMTLNSDSYASSNS